MNSLEGESKASNADRKSRDNFLDTEKQSLWGKYAEQIEADDVLGEIKQSIEKGWIALDSKNQELTLTLLKSLMENLSGYFNARFEYERANRAENGEKFAGSRADYYEAVKNADRVEKYAHDALIDSLNILSRNMGKMGLDNSWRGNPAIDAFPATPDNPIVRTKTRNWALGIFRKLGLAEHLPYSKH